MRRVAALAAVAEEVEFLDASIDELRRRHSGQFLVIRGRKVLAALPTEREAYVEGVRMCGTEPFLLAQVGARGERAWVPVLMEVEPENFRRDGYEAVGGDVDPQGNKRLRRHLPRWGPIVDNPLEVMDAHAVE